MRSLLHIASCSSFFRLLCRSFGGSDAELMAEFKLAFLNFVMGHSLQGDGVTAAGLITRGGKAHALPLVSPHRPTLHLTLPFSPSRSPPSSLPTHFTAALTPRSCLSLLLPRPPLYTHKGYAQWKDFIHLLCSCSSAAEREGALQRIVTRFARALRCQLQVPPPLRRQHFDFLL